LDLPGTLLILLQSYAFIVPMVYRIDLHNIY